MRIRFHFRLIPFIAAALLVLLGISLAQWQTRRAAEKQLIETQLITRVSAPVQELGATLVQADVLEYRRVSVRGEFVSDWPVYLDNRPQNGRPGLYVVMPFRIAGSTRHVLVERGWLALNMANRATMLPYQTPLGEIEIIGTVRRHAGRVMQLGSPAELKPGALLQNLEVSEFSRASGLAMQPILIEQANRPGAVADGLVRDWPVPSSGIDMHRGYAFQWYALAAMAFLFFVVTGFRRESD
ncbi:MAG: surfeit locus 1 family protein [Burkholderiaceae bacterium]|jgi:cytochrome oxidase assembly protein ShyY1